MLHGTWFLNQSHDAYGRFYPQNWSMLKPSMEIRSLKSKIILQGTWLGMLRQRALGAYRTPEVSGSLDHFWSESLLQHRGAHTLGTRMTHVLVDLCQHVLIFPGECSSSLSCTFVVSGRDDQVTGIMLYFRVKYGGYLD